MTDGIVSKGHPDTPLANSNTMSVLGAYTVVHQIVSQLNCCHPEMLIPSSGINTNLVVFLSFSHKGHDEIN